MNTLVKIPFYAKVGLIFLSLSFFFFIAYLGQEILLPLVFAVLVAILLNPVVDYLIKNKIGKILSIFIVVVVAIFAVVGLLYIVSSQVAMLKQTCPQLKEKFNITQNDFVYWISSKLGVSRSNIIAWINRSENEMIYNFSIEEKLTDKFSFIKRK